MAVNRRRWLGGAAAAALTELALGGRRRVAARSSVIRIGTHAAMTGRMAEAAQRVRKGADLAVQTFERLRGYRVEMIAYDDESSPQKVVELVDRLADRDKVVAILGGYGSHIDGPASEAAERHGIAYVGHLGATSRSFDRRGFKTFFRFAHLSGYVETQVAFLDVLGVKQVAVLHSSEPTAADVAALILDTLAARGVSVSVFEGFEPGASALQPLLVKVRDAKAPFLIGVGYAPDYVALVRDSTALALPVDGFLGAWSFAGAGARLGAQAEHAFGVGYWVPGTAPAAARKEEVAFVGAYARANQAIPDYLAMGGYIAGKILLEAAERADVRGAPTPASVREELARTDVMTPMGRIAFDEEGNPTYLVNTIFQVQGGREITVFPAARATGKARYPAVSWRA